ncbi:MAG: hypothetical protein ACYC37_01705 [Desulfobacteria bacterium]
MSVKRTAFGFLAFAAGLAILILGLKALNVLPLIAQKDLMRRYGDFEEMKAALGIREVSVPSYFPEEFRWPPTRILAQGKPYPAVIMEFERSGEGKAREVGMMIYQAARDDFSPGGPLALSRVRERATYPLKGRSAILEVGSGRTGEPCSRISWREKDVRITVLARLTPFELMKVAESMLR